MLLRSVSELRVYHAGKVSLHVPEDLRAGKLLVCPSLQCGGGTSRGINGISVTAAGNLRGEVADCPGVGIVAAGSHHHPQEA